MRRLLLLGAFALGCGASAVNTSPTHLANSVAALNIRVASLEKQVAVLEKTCASGVGGEARFTYFVDTAAGEIKCRSCEWVNK
jgi:hypothetical protein